VEIRKLSPGDRILDYRILERLGEGGFGEVFRAEHEVLGRIVAIKVPRDQGSLTSLRHEGCVQASLEHPNIVRTLELSISHDPPYVVMEYVQGASLAEIVRREGALPWRRAGRVLLDVARALTHAHGHGVVHGDVKPANVLVEPGRDGRVLLTDFGLGRLFEGANGSLQISRSLELATSGAEVQGTIRYLAPELLRGETADERADVYSFGVLLFEVLTGRLPEGREVPSDLVRDLPPEFDRIFARTFTRRERRPRSLAPTIDDLRAVLELDGKAKPAAPTVEPTPAPPVTKYEVVRAIPATAPEPPRPVKREPLCSRHGPRPATPVAAPVPALAAAPAAAAAPEAAPATPATATAPSLGPVDPAFARWRDAVLAQVRDRMTTARAVSVGDGQGFDVCYGVSTDGEPHHRVYALVLPALDANVARATVAAARQIFEREKGIWEKEVTFCVLAQQVRDIDQVLWAFKSFSMGWWRRRRMMLHDLETDRLYAAELGCDPRGNPLKRAFLDASSEAVRDIPRATAEAGVCAGPTRRRSVRGTAWGAALALVMAIGIVGSAMAIEFASCQVRKNRCKKPLTTQATTPRESIGEPSAPVTLGSTTFDAALLPATGSGSPAEGALTPRLPEASAAPAEGAAAPAPEVAPHVPPRAPDAFTPRERRQVEFF
jgi:hypothetical protein